MTSIRSVWAATPPVINGQAESTEWADGGWLDLPHTKVFFKNDAENLYILLDVLGCNVADGEEYFGIVVDVDRSKSVTPYTDVRFGAVHQYKGDLYRKLYTQPAVSGAVQDLTTTSEMATGFYSSFNSGTAHRIWELALNLEEIGADPTTWWGSDDRPPVVRVGVWVRSSPHISGWRDEGPDGWMMVPDQGNLADLLEISLATQPDFPAAETGPVFLGVGLIPYRKIDPATGHATTEPGAPRVVENAAFGGRLDVLGDISRLWDAGVRRYKIKYSQDVGVEQDLCQSWSNYKRELVAGVWEDVLYSIGPDADKIYDLPDPNDAWLTANLLLRWQTRGFGGGNGLYTVRLELLPAEAGAAALLGVPPADQLLSLYIDNTRPEVDILEMTHRVGGVEKVVERCAIVEQGTGGFRFHIKVDDPEGHLLRYSLVARHGDPGDPADPIPDGSQTYDSAVHGPSWNGVNEWVPHGTAVWEAPESCAYGFHLGADARITNGYCWVYQDVWCSKYVTIQVSEMREITEQLLNEIESLDLAPSYEEQICMQAVSKDLTGEFIVIEQEWQECASPPCVTLKARLGIEAEVTPHDPCDTDVSQVLNGSIQGELVFAHIEGGEDRGYHLGRFKWSGADSVLIGRMAGVTNAGTHHSPAKPCEPCDQGGHTEGRLDAVVVDGKFQGCRVLATYVMDYDPSHEAQDTGFVGTLEGVLICPCEG